MGLVIDINWDSSVNKAPAAFKPAVLSAVRDLEALFAAPITVTIDVGYGEVNGRTLGQGDLGESQATRFVTESYASVRSALQAQQAPGSSTLPTTQPDSGQLFMFPAEAKALGLLANDGTVDGYVGFSSTFPFSYADGTTPPAGQFYFIGAVEHEITEDMGRVSLLNGQPNYYAAMDLYRYTSLGGRDLSTGSSTAYFSINNGATNLGSWNNQTSNGDLGDWYPSGPAPGGNDSFNDFSSSGVINALSQNDITLMEALGYQGAATSPPLLSALVTQLPAGQLDFLEFSNTNLTASSLTPYQLWPVLAAADFNSDGKEDLVSQLGGAIDFLFYNGNGQLAASSLVNGAYWPVAGASKFNSFPQTAVITQNSATGAIDLLGFQGLNLASSELLSGGYWPVVGSGDFAGNGTTEVAVQSAATGQIDLLLFNGPTLAASALLPGSFWPVKAVANFNNSSSSDLVLQNPSTGQVDYLLINGNAIIGSYLLSTAAPMLVNGDGVAGNVFHI